MIKLYNFSPATIMFSSFVLVIMTLSALQIESHSMPQKSLTRRALLATTAILPFATTTATADSNPPTINLLENNNDYNALLAGKRTIEQLLDNWTDLTVSCLYADVPRDLLEQKNKEQLLVQASTFALFDKSASVTSCKESNSKVRQYLGIYKESGSALVGIEKKFKRLKEEFVSDDDEERWFDLVDEFNVRLSKISTLTYQSTILSQTTVGYDVNGDSKIDGEFTSNQDLNSAKVETQASLTTLMQIIELLNKVLV